MGTTARPPDTGTASVNLRDEEALGGHTIRDHVGKTPSDLMKRLAASPSKNYASSFTDVATAESAVGETIAANQARIVRWLKGSDPQFWVKSNLGRNVGIEIAKGSSVAQECSNVTVVLMRNASSPPGYRIHTAICQP